MKHQLIVISGPSGVGKGTIVKQLLKQNDFALSVSCTTRAPREGERDGVSYFFVTKEKFHDMIENNGLLEYSEHFGNYYGTPREFVEKQLFERNVILEIEVDGALNVKRAFPEALLIMIAPPDKDALVARLEGRGTETPQKIEERLKRAEYELSKKDEYDYVVVNDDLNTAVGEVLNIIKTNKRS